MNVLIKGVKMPRCCEVCPCNDDNWRCGALGGTFEDLELYDLEHKPSCCPLVEVVRCKECKFWNKDENVLRGICDEWSDFEDGISRYTGSDDYCSYGERKEK